ncbi:MAG: hypothetical protein EPO08_05660 [Rhodospirillaceae bacterium]|nr:MAG: hypothetical protein EPO08_05660 [Rhodospirillaceae bacterium]
MNVTKLSYEKMVEDALRGVLRQALQITAAQGLPGSHHFYITFDTTHPGVKIADTLKTQHPNEMTIVLQHQFWDLKVAQDQFEITLSFSGVSQRLLIPFAAVTAFADPHAKFGLQFHVEFEERTAADEELDMEDDAEDGDGAEREEPMPVDSAKVSRQIKGRKTTLRPVTDAPAESGEEGAKVVTLDAFRKK